MATAPCMGTQLRKTNRALPYGRQIQKYVSESLYAYTRCYRENRVLVVINKGGEACIDIGQTELPDGLHQCLLTNRTIPVS